MGYVYMFLGLGSFSMLGVFAKIADIERCRPSALYVLLFCWACALSWFASLVSGQPVGAAPAKVIWLGLPFGVAGALAGLAFQTGIRYGGKISTSWLIINLSAAIPTLASVFIYREPVKPLKIVALCLIAVSVFLLWKDKLEDERKVLETAASRD
jgi:drug/metabolite transporter (DMT)-like permease